MLLFLHSLLFSGHLFQFFLLSQALQHLLSKIYLQKFFFFFLFFFELPLLTLSVSQHLFELLFFPLLLSFFFLNLFFIQELIILHSYVFKFFQLFLALLFCLFKFQINGLFLFFLALKLLALLAYPLIEFTLILGNLFQFLLLFSFELHTNLLFLLVLFKHCSVILLFLRLLRGDSINFLSLQFANCLINHLFLFFILLPSLSFKFLSVNHLRFQYILIFTFFLLSYFALLFFSFCLALHPYDHFCLFLGFLCL